MISHTINVPLLRKVLEHITEHPEEHNQAYWALRWSCGTTYCLAGHAVVLSGIELDWARSERTTSYTADGEFIKDVAAKLLGLSLTQRLLFGANNTLDCLWLLAEEYTHGEIQRPLN